MIFQRSMPSWKNWIPLILCMSPHPLRPFKSSNTGRDFYRPWTLSWPMSTERRPQQLLPCSTDLLSLLTSNHDHSAVVICHPINLLLQVSSFQSLFPLQLLIWVVWSWPIIKIQSTLLIITTWNPIRKSSKAITHSCLCWWFYSSFLVNFLIAIKRGL